MIMHDALALQTYKCFFTASSQKLNNTVVAKKKQKGREGGGGEQKLTVFLFTPATIQ